MGAAVKAGTLRYQASVIVKSAKTHSVYLSQYQMLPLARVRDYFEHELGIPISQGSIANFNARATSILD